MLYSARNTEVKKKTISIKSLRVSHDVILPATSEIFLPPSVAYVAIHRKATKCDTKEFKKIADQPIDGYIFFALLSEK
jgi:hypothetical protein